MATQLDRIEQMLRALCAHLGVQESEKLGNGQGQDLGVDSTRRYTGVVSRFEHGWGFIECEAMNRNYFVHYSDIEGTGLRSLDPGDVVSFEIAPGKDGRPKAVRVRRHSTGQPVPRTPRYQAAYRPGYGSREQGLPEDDVPAETAEPRLEESSAAPDEPDGSDGE